MAENQVGVLILCRNGLLRESLARILSKKPDIRVVGVDSVAPSSAEEIANLGADVLVLDSLHFLLERKLSITSGHEERSSFKCLLIAMEDDQRQFLAAVQCGALGYVLQEASAVEVLTAIRAVTQGQAVCPSSMTKVLFDFVASRALNRPNSRDRRQLTLTSREQQLIPLIGQGLTNKEIAAELQLAEQTVKNHVHRILRKVGAEDRLSVYEAYQERALGL